MVKVSVLETRPSSVLEDYGRLMELADFDEHMDIDIETMIKINLSWTLFFPACSTQPWQLEGVLKWMGKRGYNRMLAVENQTVVTHPWKGAYENKWLPVLKRYGVDFRPLTDVKWVPYKPRAEMLAMDELFGGREEGLLVPEMFLGTNMLHLPTVKTHGHTTITGAMKNAFGGLIPKYRHHAHRMIHEVLVDLLSIQKEIHKGIFSITDGTTCGDGAGPRTMKLFDGNIILGSEDQVAIDAVSAKLMGFDPLKIDFIKMAHDKGLGMGDVDQIEIVGMDDDEFDRKNFGFRTKRSLVIRWDQRIRKSTARYKNLHSFLFHSSFFKTFIFASEFYHDYLWYPTVGKSRIKGFSRTPWGQLFDVYRKGDYPDFADIKEWDPY